MSGEFQTQSRKRRDRKKKKECDSDRLDVPQRLIHDTNDDDSSCKEDLDDHGKDEKGTSHHQSSVGLLSTVVFFFLLGGLVVLTVMIFIELKDSKDVGPTITESRYANILGDLVDEHPYEDEDHEDSHSDDNDDIFTTSHDDDDLTEENVNYFSEEDAAAAEDVMTTTGEGLIHELFDLLHLSSEPNNLTSDEEGLSKENEVEPQELLVEDSKPEILNEFDDGMEPNDFEASHTEAEVDTEDVKEEHSQLDDSSDRPHLDNDHTEQSEIEHTEENSDISYEFQDDSHILPSDTQAPSTEEGIADVSDEFQEDSQILPTYSDTQTPLTEENDSPESLTEENDSPESLTEENDSPESLTEENDSPESLTEENDNPESLTSDINTAELNQEDMDMTNTIERKEESIEPEETREQEEPAETEENVAEEPSTNSWQSYEYADITNQYDNNLREKLDAAEEELTKSAERCIQMFDDILRLNPESPRASYGKAKCLDKMSEQRRSNKLLEESIVAYSDTLNLPDVPDRLFRMTGERCVDRMIFRGFIAKAVTIQWKLIKKFPQDAVYRNQLAVSFLLMGKNKAAKEVLTEVLEIFPNNGFAKAHYGFILKTDESNYKEGIRYMQEGIATKEPGTIDGRIFFHLGDALMREGFLDQAYAVYEEGVKHGLFLSAYQRSLYNVDTLTGRPWWTVEETTYSGHLKKLQDNWQMIRDEGLSILDSKQQGFLPESENLRDTGIWKQFEIFARGKKNEGNCHKVPQTCRLIETIPDAAGCKRGQVKFSIMHPDTHVWAHTGPTNCRIRAHLGLVVPDGARIRVANETRSWEEGKFIIFDDSFEHEVWHEGKTFRLVLIVDLWHPELTEHQKQTLSPI